MIFRVVLLFLLAGPAIIQALNIPVVCPCTFVANRALKVGGKVIRNVLGKEQGSTPLPRIKFGESYQEYIVRLFTRQPNESDEAYYTRIYQRYKDESDEKYVERIDAIHAAFPTLPTRDRAEYWQYNERYFTLKYGRLSVLLPLIKESNDQYFARILRREKDEDFNAYIRRLDCVFMAYPKLDIWRRVKFDSDTRNWYFYRHVAYNCAIRPSENIRESIAVQYDRRPNEKDDDISYFKRIVTRLQGESDEDYVDRLTRIRSRFSSLPLWYNREYVDLVRKYYSLLYAKKEDEQPKDYYKRITTKSTSEDFPTYVKRIELLQRIFNDLPLWNNCEYLQFTGPFYTYIYRKKEGEDNETYLKRITTRQPAEPKEAYLQRLNVVRWVNRKNDLFYNRAYWPFIEKYYEGYFKKGKLELDYWLSRVFKRDFEESDDEYVRRCSLLFTSASLVKDLSNIDLPQSALKYASDFYRLYYKRGPNEKRESWLERVTKRLPIETDVSYETRLKYLENVYSDCRGVVSGLLKRLFGGRASCQEDKEVEVVLFKKKQSLSKQKTDEKITVVAEVSKKPEKKTIEEEIEEIYGKKKGEDETTWFKRLVQKSSDETPEQYLKTLNLVRKFFPSIPLWYSKQNFDLVKDYYTALYAKLPNESDEQYCSRITSKEPWESWEQAAERVALIRSLYPTLPFWTDEKYYDKYIKNLYTIEYKQKPTETYEQYVERILAKDPLIDVSNEVWASRIRLIEKATASSPLWYDEKYYPLTKSFFQAWYKKDENEGCTTWLTRVLRRLEGESEDSAIKRVRLVKQTTGDCGCWTEFTFAKVKGSRLLSQEYLNDIEKEFFDSEMSYERIYSSFKSQFDAASSAAAADASVKVEAKV